MNFRVIFISFFFSLNFLFSKINNELEKNPFIKTVVFSGGSFNSQFPIIKMNQVIKKKLPLIIIIIFHAKGIFVEKSINFSSGILCF